MPPRRKPNQSATDFDDFDFTASNEPVVEEESTPVVAVKKAPEAVAEPKAQKTATPEVPPVSNNERAILIAHALLLEEMERRMPPGKAKQRALVKLTQVMSYIRMEFPEEK